jgi:hypothetical protein
MARAEESLKEELRKARIFKVIYLLAGLGLFVLGVSLLVMLIIRRDLPALFLAIGGFIFGALMMNQALRQREREDTLEAQLESLSSARDEPAPGGRVPDGPEEGDGP